MPIVVDDRMEEVRQPGVFRVPHRAVMEEDVLVGPREIPAVLHIDDEEPVPCPSSRDCLQLGQRLHGELLQVLKSSGIPGDRGNTAWVRPSVLRQRCQTWACVRVVCACACLSCLEAPVKQRTDTDQACASHLNITVTAEP